MGCKEKNISNRLPPPPPKSKAPVVSLSKKLYPHWKNISNRLPPIKGSRCFLEQETLPSLFRTG